jgi:hypothetical protein
MEPLGVFYVVVSSHMSESIKESTKKLCEGLGGTILNSNPDMTDIKKTIRKAGIKAKELIVVSTDSSAQVSIRARVRIRVWLRVR